MASAEVEDILAPLSALTIGGTASEKSGPVGAGISALLVRDVSESEEDFELRKRLALSFANLTVPKINDLTAVTAARMVVNKAKLGVTYSEREEIALNYLLRLIQGS
jgi:hypothetical protein